MSISQREQRLVLAAGLVVAAFLFVFVIIPKLRGGDDASVNAGEEASLRSIHQDVKRKEQLARTLDEKTKKLSIKIPSEPPDAQVQGFVKTLEEVAGKSQVQLTTLQPKAVAPGRAARGRRAGNEVSYDLRFTTGHEGFVNFIKNLEEAGVPYVVDSMDMKNEGGPGQLAVTMEMTFTILEPMKHEKDA